MQKVTLFITPAENQPGQYLVVVDGDGFFEAPDGAKVGGRVRGDDRWFDETLFPIGNFTSRVFGGIFNLSTTVPGSELNEDWGQDEIYAVVNIEGLSGEFRSNTVKGSF
jgi:hypothetical protein